MAPTLLRSAKGLLIALGLTAVVVCACAVAAFATRARNKWRSSLADAVVRNGPLEESPSAFTVHDGAELAVLDHKNEWLQVEVDGGRTGWIRKDQVVVTD